MAQKMTILPTLLLLMACLVTGDGCTSTSKITRSSELANPLETGEITVLTTTGSRFDLTNYRVTDSTLVAAGTLAGENPVNFSGEIRWSDISYIQTTRFSLLKSVLTLGIIGFGASAFGKDFTVDQKTTYHGPTGGSCPFVYTYDGTDYHLESETFAGAVFKGAERTTVDRLYHLRPVDGLYSVRIVNERPESEYTNLFSLLVVDADPSARPLPDATGNMHTIRNPLVPLTAVDLDGRNCLRQITSTDGVYWESDITGRDFTKDGALRDGIVITFPKPENARCAKLVVRGVNTSLGVFAFEQLFQMKGKNRLEWYRQLEGDPLEGEKLLGFIRREGMLHVSVLANGTWKEESALFDVGPVVPKEQLAVLDVQSCPGGRLVIRLECAVDLWRIDQVAVDYSDDEPVSCRELMPARAVDESGRDLRKLLAEDDALYYGAAQGQSATLSFPVPPDGPGQERFFFARARGYYHQWFAPTGADQTALLDRILTSPQLGGKLLMAKWRSERQMYQHTGN